MNNLTKNLSMVLEGLFHMRVILELVDETIAGFEGIGRPTSAN